MNSIFISIDDAATTFYAALRFPISSSIEVSLNYLEGTKNQYKKLLTQEKLVFAMDKYDLSLILKL